MRSILIYTVGGALILLALSHIVDPMSVRATRAWSETIAADLVSRSMVPHRFTEVVDGVTMIIGSRNSSGEITDFFADDTRSADSRRTYFAKTALITRDEQGFILRMVDGATQRMSAEGRLSQISFDRYDLALDQLTGQMEEGDAIARLSSLDIIGKALNAEEVSPAERQALVKRSIDGLRVLGMCLFVAALAMFPRGSRTGRRFRSRSWCWARPSSSGACGSTCRHPSRLGRLPAHSCCWQRRSPCLRCDSGSSCRLRSGGGRHDFRRLG